MAADETNYPGTVPADPNSPAPADVRAVLDQARARCRQLVADLRRDASELQRPSRHLSPEALAEGRAAYDRAGAAAENLLRFLDESPDPLPGPSPDPRA